MSRRPFSWRARAGMFAFLALGVVAAVPATAQGGYREPPAAIKKILDAPPLPYTVVSPDRRTMLLLHRISMPTIEDMAAPMLRLAGTRIDPRTNDRHGPNYIVGVTIKHIDSGREIDVDLPDNVGIGGATFSPDGRRFAFEITTDEGVALWVADASTGAARALTAPILNPIMISPRWMPGGERIRVALIPDDRGEAPVEPNVPTGPTTQESVGGKSAPVRTYQDLLSNSHDERLFDHYFTSQLAIINVADGERADLGAPAVYMTADPSPTGEYMLIERVSRPYSYLVPARDFPREVEIWSASSGRRIARLARLPLAERVPIGGVITGPRSHQWRDSAGVDEIYYVEALDEGDPDKDVDRRDVLYALDAPFTGEPREITRTEDRFIGLSWPEKTDLAMLLEYDRDERWVRTWAIEPANPDASRRLIWDRSWQDRYSDPGSPITIMNEAGRSVPMVVDGWMYLSGRGASPDGDRPFIDRMNLASLETERLWRCSGDNYESVVDVLTPDAGKILTRYETPSTPPNYYARSLESGERTALTDFEHPAPEILGVSKQLVTYERADGVTCSATLYLPADYQEGERLPLIVWAYPREFNDPSLASQVSGSEHRFTMFGGTSHLFFLTQGYAIMDGASMPVVGPDPETVNDNFREQIVDSARAAIEYAAERGVADPDRVGVGGHSYGAFMTANLLAHSDLFRAGIARSGAYNRTLTPFGFQAERRTLWEAPEIYFAISPFMHADKINEPMLMIHGEVDNNSGTFPIQSERMYHAVKGNGGHARLVMLPHESHGYRARESVMHVLAEMVDWFETNVKYAPPREEASAAN